MFKKAASILLLTAFLATPARFMIPYIWYCSNYHYIVHELCVNRDKPGMNCDGKCQLKRMIQEQHHHGDQSPTPQVVREQRMNLFFAEHLLTPVVPTSFSFPHFDYTNQMKPLWFNEPVSPPPQMS